MEHYKHLIQWIGSRKRLDISTHPDRRWSSDINPRQDRCIQYRILWKDEQGRCWESNHYGVSQLFKVLFRTSATRAWRNLGVQRLPQSVANIHIIYLDINDDITESSLWPLSRLQLQCNPSQCHLLLKSDCWRSRLLSCGHLSGLTWADADILNGSALRWLNLRYPPDSVCNRFNPPDLLTPSHIGWN